MSRETTMTGPGWEIHISIPTQTVDHGGAIIDLPLARSAQLRLTGGGSWSLDAAALKEVARLLRDYWDRPDEQSTILREYVATLD